MALKQGRSKFKHLLYRNHSVMDYIRANSEFLYLDITEEVKNYRLEIIN
jgi:hypothetical protein